MFQLDDGRPGDRRGFVHKRLLSGVKGFITSGGNPLAGVKGFVGGGGTGRAPPPRRTVSRGDRPSITTAMGKETGRQLKFGPEASRTTILDRAKKVFGFNGDDAAACLPPFRRDPRTGQCKIFAGEQSGVDDTPVGDAVMGRYGAALQPGSRVIDRAVCLPGMQLANDGLCYNKGVISNKQRMWPAGRKPLLTGGQMRAISIAATAARQVGAATKRLQSLGMLKKPMPRKTKAVVIHDDHHHHV